MRFVLGLLIITLTGFYTVSGVTAADLEVVCDSNGCSSSDSSFFFPASETWVPGKSSVRTFKIDNNSGREKTIKVESRNKSGSGNLDEVLELFIKKSGESSHIWAGSLNNFLNAGSIELEKVAGGQAGEFEFKVNFDPTAGNIYQGSTLTFDLIFSYSDSNENPVIPEETGEPDNGEGNNPENADSSSGGNNARENIIGVGATGLAGISFVGGEIAEQTAGGITAALGEIKGLARTEKVPKTGCQAEWLFIILPLIQAGLSFVISKKAKKDNLKLISGILLGIYLLVNLAILKFFCIDQLYGLWVTTAILASLMLLLERKFKPVTCMYIRLAV